jgi:hypothetical protein
MTSARAPGVDAGITGSRSRSEKIRPVAPRPFMIDACGGGGQLAELSAYGERTKKDLQMDQSILQGRGRTGLT